MITITTSAVDDFMCALVDRLNLREELARDDNSRVQVTSGPMGGDTEKESIQLFGTDGEQEWGMLGNLRREETFTVRGSLYVADVEKDEGAIRRVRARAIYLLRVIEAVLRDRPDVPDVNGHLTVRAAALKTYQLDQGVSAEERWCEIGFTIEAKKSLPTS